MMYRGYDKGVIKEYFNDGNTPAGEQILILLYQSTIAGDPTKGIAKTFNYITIRSKAVITVVTQQDIVQSGGIYQVGDLKVQLQKQLTPIDDVTGYAGDRIVWKGHTYRMVGNIDTILLENHMLFNYTFRRI